MNLSGPNQRLKPHHQAQGEDANISILFRSRPLFAGVDTGQTLFGVNDGERRGEWWLRLAPERHASVLDEVRAAADGALLRRIRILITDGPQCDPEKSAWARLD